MPRIALPGEPLRDGGTALRPWRDEDLRDLVALCQDPEIARWTRVPFPYRETDGRLYLLHRYDLLQAGASAPFAITGPGSELIGSISLIQIRWEDARAEVGYWLGRDGRGHGHATRAVRMICEWGFGSLGLGRVELLAATGNHPSQRVAEHAGFTREAVLRSYAAGRDGRQDMVAFGLLAADSRRATSSA
jgi:RimJ/RimL family protein N-acetyltransferase